MCFPCRWHPQVTALLGWSANTVPKAWGNVWQLCWISYCRLQNLLVLIFAEHHLPRGRHGCRENRRACGFLQVL